MTETLLHFIMFFGPAFAVVISLGQFVRANKGFIDYLFAVSFLGMAVWIFQISLISTGLIDNYKNAFLLIAVPMPLIYLIPPIMVTRYRWVLASKFKINRHYLIFLIPPAISLGMLLYKLIPDASGSDIFYPALPVLSSSFVPLPPYTKALYLMIIGPHLYIALLMCPILVQMLPVWNRDHNNRISKAARMGYLSALSIVISNLLCFSGYIVSLNLVKAAVIIANCATVYVYLVTQRHQEYYRLLRSETRKAHYEKSRIRGLDVKSILTRMDELMKDEKAFADEELTLRDLAGELGISPHQLSEMLNEKLKKNFNTYVNEFRVEEAKKMLKEEPNRSILSVGIAAGFNSNTTFCTVFSKIAGFSPSQYRKNSINK